jgi:radical SAM superfamily enzyme YgiQ (UPF0313 family)
LIFQFYLPLIQSLLDKLRSSGIKAHYTIGGHYPSFEYETVLQTLPILDSVVRFEGEDTLADLTDKISMGLSWKAIHGIAYRSDSGIVLNPKRVGRANLDEIPWPDRSDFEYNKDDIRTASILGSRGCTWNCSFCSIVRFYEGNMTKGRRFRSPIAIVDEISHLNRSHGIQVLLWQDDDFLCGGSHGVEWAHSVAKECIARGLHRNVRWKISCRSNELTAKNLKPLVEAGLVHVYLGVESGDPESLKNLNKSLSVQSHFRARDALLELGVAFDFGFMLLEPWSTLKTIRNNLDFLRRFVSDGSSVAGFCRMLPYAGTTVENRLRNEGRLLREGFRADYKFLDHRLDVLYNWLLLMFSNHNHSSAGMVNVLRELKFRANLSLPVFPFDPLFRESIKNFAAISNNLMFNTIEAAVNRVESKKKIDLHDAVLTSLGQRYKESEQLLRHKLSIYLRAWSEGSAVGTSPEKSTEVAD